MIELFISLGIVGLFALFAYPEKKFQQHKDKIVDKKRIYLDK